MSSTKAGFRNFEGYHSLWLLWTFNLSPSPCLRFWILFDYFFSIIFADRDHQIEGDSVSRGPQVKVTEEVGEAEEVVSVAATGEDSVEAFVVGLEEVVVVVEVVTMATVGVVDGWEAQVEEVSMVVEEVVDFKCILQFIL